MMQLPSVALSLLSIIGAATALTNKEIFANPIQTRLYQGSKYVLEESHSTALRVNVTQVTQAILEMKPSYVNGLIYFGYNAPLTADMLSDFNEIRSDVSKALPNTRWDVELSLNPQVNGKKPTYSSATELVNYMKHLDSQLHVDGWWFDFYTNAQEHQPSWVKEAVAYAHGKGQTVGGNVWDDKVPPGSDAVSFVDKPDKDAPQGFGYGYNPSQISKLNANKGDGHDCQIIGHLQDNPQNEKNGPTESCVYTEQWSSTRRYEYLKYWVDGQAKYDFTFMLPLFYPQCPIAYAFNPLDDKVPSLGETLYDWEKSVAVKR